MFAVSLMTVHMWLSFEQGSQLYKTCRFFPNGLAARALLKTSVSFEYQKQIKFTYSSMCWLDAHVATGYSNVHRSLVSDACQSLSSGKNTMNGPLRQHS